MQPIHSRIRMTRLSRCITTRCALSLKLFTLSAALLCAASTAGAATILVTANAPDVLNGADTSCALREAIQNINDGANTYADCAATGAYGVNDAITLPSGSYTNAIAGRREDLNATGDLDILKPLTITGATNTIIDGGGIDRVFDISTAGVVKIVSVTIRNGRSINTNALLDRDGGGILLRNGTLNVTNATISGNSAFGTPGVTGNGGGILIFSAGTASVTNSTISGNTADAEGGGIDNAGSLAITNSTISNNTITGAVIHGQGGGIMNGGLAALTVTNSTISGNTASDGGGIMNQGKLTITNAILRNNRAIFTGNGIVAGDNLGGGIFTLAGTVSISSSTISNNIAGSRDITGKNIGDGEGGGIAAGSFSVAPGVGTLRICNSTISGNTASFMGGGIFATSGFPLAPPHPPATNVTVHITHSTISGNSATGFNSSGLGNGTTVAVGSGGGIANRNATLRVTNATISGNTASVGGGGSLIDVNGVITAVNTTVTSNSAPVGGGIDSIDAPPIITNTINLKNSIVANQASGGDCNTTVTNILNDLDSDGTCGVATTANPLLGPLQNNGGSTLTHALLNGSPAIDAGDATTCASTPVNSLDQRGIFRPQGAGCDIGAFEFGASPPPASADLAVSKTAAPDPVVSGGNLTYTVTVTNNGPTDPATGVTMTDTLPAGVTFVSATPSQGAACTQAGVTVTCNLGNVSAATSATIAIVVTPTQAGQITNSAMAAGNETDPTPCNNTTQVTTTVNAAPPPPANADLAVSKTAAPNPVVVGNNLTYTVNVTNNGPTDPATGVTMTDTLPAGVTFVSATPSQGAACTQAGVTVTCNLGNVSAATSATIAIVVTPTQAGQITNSAMAAGNETDPTPANNTAQVTTTVNAAPPPVNAPPVASGGGLGGCTLGHTGRPDPVLPMLILLSMLTLWRRKSETS